MRISPFTPSPLVKKPVIAVTLGDPAGVGPEVTLKAISALRSSLKAQVLLLGPSCLFEAMAKKIKSGLYFKTISDISDLQSKTSSIPCFFPRPFKYVLRHGCYNKPLTDMAAYSIELAVDLALAKKVNALVTAPIHKAGFKKAGYMGSGHTEYLAQKSRTKHFDMMLAGGPLRVVVVTRHVAIKNVPTLISKEKVLETILLTDRELRKSFGIERPRLLIAGLNPHAGENGGMGREEIEHIIPAVAAARRKTNAEIIGPLSPDILFCEAIKGGYDAQICMYHDQGLIPLKMMARGFGVNITLGLPFVRTSPDHGTAYDIAPLFKADPGSMVEALKLSQTLYKNRLRYDQS